MTANNSGYSLLESNMAPVLNLQPQRIRFGQPQCYLGATTLR
jgi:hypothetical protein